MNQSGLLRDLRALEKLTAMGPKRNLINEAISFVFRMPAWQRLVDVSKKVYPYADAENESIRGACSFIIPYNAIVRFTEDYDIYKKGMFEVIGPNVEFGPEFYDTDEEVRKKMNGILVIPTILLNFLPKWDEDV